MVSAATGAFGVVLEKLADMIGDACARLVGVCGEVTFLKAELEHMGALLVRLSRVSTPTSRPGRWRRISEAGKQLKVVSVVGFGGMGKTTLANQIYCSFGVQFKYRAFVSASQNPDVVKVLRGIMSQLSKREYSSTESGDERQLIDKILDFLRDKRYFIVIDDVWSVETWEIIKCAISGNSFGNRAVRRFSIFGPSLLDRPTKNLPCCFQKKKKNLPCLLFVCDRRPPIPEYHLVLIKLPSTHPLPVDGRELGSPSVRPPAGLFRFPADKREAAVLLCFGNRPPQDASQPHRQAIQHEDDRLAKLKRSINKMREPLMLAATVWAWTAFLSALHPPGGSWKHGKDGHAAGTPDMASHGVFRVLTAMAFAASALLEVLLSSERFYRTWDGMARLLLVALLDVACVVSAYVVGADPSDPTHSPVFLLGTLMVLVFLFFGVPKAWRFAVRYVSE
ncbi:uncharacterized protein LOC119339115 [Triticum dicoccoides]|uniref:uncharacterized protein LOC119339115 n=1 Tax=Triticum dicoccoides TaxID=85692 RepID=UPI001891937D|nr:uncharacterized protein LOC119339115 [Triticum dicoccoides]